VRDLDVGEVAETGVDAVGRRVALREFVDDGARGGHAPSRGVTERHVVVAICVVAVCDRNELIKRQRIAVDRDRTRISHHRTSAPSHLRTFAPS
jgi:hypothetical protein